ncbi:hypothetical protein phiKDA1_32 (endogenous virus) [Enterobacter phage phiKDA1]|uniref:Uncharacterized protein n=1 Tax=Enterobacter phage phiKDA1 TaxID=1147139 RepID=A0A0A6Z584_9CAUD|nr:hypothetical protein HOQ86_gp33 [Enterobacter phage phiKDA1]AFE86125.1 hypothetical protein phiKDA1_32 [Enterobacter phage phiKDA1]
MSTFTKEQLIEEVNYNLEHCFCSEKTKRLMEIALVSLKAEGLGQKPVGLFAKRNGTWLELCQGDTFEHPDGVPLYTAPLAPVSDSLLSELLAIAKKAADAADECAHAEWSDDSMEHSTAIADWERRAAMLQEAK